MVNDSTRAYSVYISDENNSVQGSGVLFYAGGKSAFVFTCAHVVDGLEKIRLFILKEINAACDRYDVFCTEISSSQVVYSPLDEVRTDDAGTKTHTEDIAIIQLGKPESLEIPVTNFLITETYRNRPVYVQGYPNGVPDGRSPIEYLDCLHGCVVVNPTDSNRFTIRMDNTFIDAGSRVYELEGLSGAPVWEDSEEVNGLLGVFTSAYGATALLSKTFVTKAQQLRSIMKERFGIVMKRKLEGIPEQDVAGSSGDPIVFNGEIQTEEKSENEKWIENQLVGLRCIIEDLKLQDAIDRAKELIADSQFASLSKESQKKGKQYLLYCYEIADMDAEFDALEADMRESGLIKEHDVLRQLTRSFMQKKFQETVVAAQHYIDTEDSTKSKTLLSFAKAFLLLAKAYTEQLPIEETIGVLLNEQEKFIYPTDEVEDEALVYQMIGYVYGERYHDNVNAVRFLNRSYQIGYDNIVLESLGAAYYNLAVYDATDENGRIPDFRKIDKKALYKARECFLIIKEKADELFWAGTMRRIGLCVYNTFVFLHDNYRILTIYPDVKKYLPKLPADAWRDVEMKYAKVSVQKGEIDAEEFPHITEKDKSLLEAIARSSRCMSLIEDVTVNVPTKQIRGLLEIANEIIDTLNFLEIAVEKIEKSERVPIYVQMINLYGRGILMFGWNKKHKMESIYNCISDCDDTNLLESMRNFIFEMDAPIEEAINRFKEMYESHKNIITWQELNHLYIRHGMFDKADAMYRELFSEHKELIAEGPEYAYRAFIDYVMLYRRDLKYALQCYLDAKESFKDTDIEGFWELELMFYVNSFNDPERFETERKHFVEKGLVTEEAYHRTAFIAYLTNLNKAKALEHYNYIRQYPHWQDSGTGMVVAKKEEIYFLNWMGVLKPGRRPSLDSMGEEKAGEVSEKYKTETWHPVIDRQFKNQFRVKKSIAMDAWSLYQLAEMNALDDIQSLDYVYVSHITVTRLLEELSKTNNLKIRIILEYIQLSDNTHIYTAGFKSQLEVRNVAQYHEFASTVAVAIEKDCVAVYGDPIVDDSIIEHFRNRIVRVNDLESLLAER